MTGDVREIVAGESRLRVRITGDGSQLVLLPGLGRPATDLDPFAAYLVAAGYKTVQPDPRGDGGSTGPMDGITLHDLAADIAAVIEAIGAPEAIRLGHAADTPRDIRAQAVRAAWYGPGRDISVWMDGWSEPVTKAYLAAAAATDIAAWWTAGAARVLIVQGLADVSAPPETGRLLKAEIGARAELVELVDVGHSVPVEDPEGVARVVIERLRATHA
jgi:pimeloyl-ACP methyl ester carboxylesterase